MTAEPTTATAHDVQWTFALIKSGALAQRNAPTIMEDVAATGLEVVRVERFQPMPTEIAERLYAEHEGRHYHARLIASVTGPDGTHALAIRGPDAIARLRALIGPTDPTTAPKHTIRGRFGTVLPDNAMHSSDSAESAARELGLFFPDLVRE